MVSTSSGSFRLGQRVGAITRRTPAAISILLHCNIIGAMRENKGFTQSCQYFFSREREVFAFTLCKRANSPKFSGESSTRPKRGGRCRLLAFALRQSTAPGRAFRVFRVGPPNGRPQTAKTHRATGWRTARRSSTSPARSKVVCCRGRRCGRGAPRGNLVLSKPTRSPRTASRLLLEAMPAAIGILAR